MNTEPEATDLTDAQVAEIDALPCQMFHEPPFDFAWCETHDETFPLGSVCKHYRKPEAEHAQS